VDALRVFIAIDTPAEVKRRMTILRDELAGRMRDVRWESAAKYHCTLRFLGDIERSKLPSVEAAVRSAAAGSLPLSLGFSAVGVFPGAGKARVIWVGIRDVAGSLARLQERLAGSLGPLGFPPEERPYHPHVTLGRIGNTARASGLIEIVETCTFEHPPVIIPAVEVMQSVLSPRGSEYHLLRSIPLEGA
jgi:RNA 2',3'-cyclic 3'-phosphodiesterase